MKRLKILNNSADKAMVIQTSRELYENNTYKNVPIVLSIDGDGQYEFYWWNRPDYLDEWLDMYVNENDNGFVPQWEHGYHFQESQVTDFTELSTKMNALIEKYKQEHLTDK